MEELTLYKINGSYLLKGSGYNSSIIEVDGKRYLDFKEGWLSEKPNTIATIRKGSRITNYGSLSVEEYQEALKGVTPEKKNCDGNPIFTPEERFIYEKFRESYQPVYEEYEEQLIPTIIEYDVTGNLSNQYIVPLRLLGLEPVKDKNVVYRYSPNIYKMAQTVAKEYGFEEIEDKYSENTKGMKWCVPDHSKGTLEYMKLNAHYAHKKVDSNGITCGTYEECLGAYLKHINAITSIFQHEKDMMNAVGVPVDKEAVVKKLEALKHRVANINAKRSSEEHPQNICANITELINSILNGETK
jgi:hypothetical protein